MSLRSGMRRSFCLVLILILCAAGGARAYQPGTLYSGVRNDEVKKLQTALIQLGYLGGTPDGIYGTHTEKAVKKFQRANGLKADGVAGAKTQELVYQKAGQSGTKTGTAQSGGNTQTAQQASAQQASAQQASAQQASAQQASAQQASSGSGLFSGNYGTLRMGSTGSRVKIMQQRLIELGYLKGSADGKYGKGTRQAVIAFQKAAGLSADGLAGKKTLQALEKSGAGTAGKNSGEQAAAQTESRTESGGDPSSSATASGPSGGQVRLLHWYNDIKPSLRNGQVLYIYEPGSKQGWNLRIYSCGRHCDAEPCTAEDTANLLKAFGGSNTWSQKAVYVKLPGGTWTIGSTHDMPHMSGSIKDNNFDGHLCVHFLRTMSEAQQYDPSYGVSNQNTIRSFWKSLTGETITD